MDYLSGPVDYLSRPVDYGQNMRLKHFPKYDQKYDRSKLLFTRKFFVWVDGLKIRVSVVQFRPWAPLFSNDFSMLGCIYLYGEMQLFI